MNVVSLSCRNCGAPLQIKEEMEQLACVHCGAQMHVERGGGTISLQMVEALGSIRTGAAQTAAELALVRLEKELNSALGEVYRLELDIERGHERLKSTIQYFKEQDIMSETALALAHKRIETLNTEVETLKAEKAWVTSERYGNVLSISIIIAGVILIIVCILVAMYFESGLSLILSGIIAVILWVIIICIWGAGAREERLNKRLEEISFKDVKERIDLHQRAVELREQIEEATSAIARSNELLPAARASVAPIEEEIAHNKKIVSSKH